MKVFSTHLKNLTMLEIGINTARNRNKGRKHGHSPKTAYVPAGEKNRSAIIQNALKEVGKIY